MELRSKQLLIGLPSTGKTTFLAALWHVVGYEELRESLVLDRLEGDHEYLNNIRDEWLRCEKMGRTVTGPFNLTYMRLREPDNDKIITEIIFPDISGEMFKTQWEERRWLITYADLVKDATGILLFVHPDQVKVPVSINQVDHVTSVDESNIEPIVEWDPKNTPTQVILVDLLQAVFKHSVHDKLRLAVVVSAWDKIEKTNNLLNKSQTPDEWLSQTLPLLDQYIKSNHEIFRAQVYGVSAQGGELETDKEKLQQITKPSERIIVMSKEQKTHDITIPIRWVMKLDE